MSLVNTGMGLPPVVVGLFVTIFLWRNGPLGFLEILYTPTAMIIAQAIIATPIVMGITVGRHPEPAREPPAPDPGPGRDPAPDGLDPDARRRACRSWPP